MDLRKNRARNWSLLNSGEPLPQERRLAKPNRETLPEQYEIERIITQKTCPLEGELYLVQWKGYQLFDCTWEPRQHIPAADLHQFLEPVVNSEQLKVYAKTLEEAVQSRLTSTNNRVSICMTTDIFRHIFGHDNNCLVDLQAFSALPLSTHWYYKYNTHGQGTKLNFPVRVKSTVQERTVFIPNANGVVKKKIPIERLVLICDTVVC